MRAIAWAIGVTAAVLIFAAGWMVPNWTEWEQCGTPTLTAAARGVFGKPSTMECLAAKVGQDTPEPAASSGDPLSNHYVPYPTEQPAPDCIRVTPADNGPWWVHADGTPCW
jgi:hypothetical protein